MKNNIYEVRKGGIPIIGYSNSANSYNHEQIIEKNSSFHVTRHTVGKVQFLFSGSYLLVLTKFSFWDWEENWTLVIIPWSFDIILNFPNFLRPYVLSCLATWETTCIYQFITNNQASFHLWRKENLIKHKKFSKYYDHGCRSRSKKLNENNTEIRIYKMVLNHDFG